MQLGGLAEDKGSEEQTGGRLSLISRYSHFISVRRQSKASHESPRGAKHKHLSSSLLSLSLSLHCLLFIYFFLCMTDCSGFISF